MKPRTTGERLFTEYFRLSALGPTDSGRALNRMDSRL